MPKRISFRVLMRAIKQAYSRVTLALLHRRIDKYRQAGQDTKPYASDMGAPLSEVIGGIAGKAKENPADADNIHYDVLTSSPASAHIPAKYNAAELHVINKLNAGELSRYFKSRSRRQGLPPGMEEKLEHSTWQHLHAAVRFARQGDEHNAKMHADIASEACKELAHYMNEQQYMTFIAEVEKYLAVLAPQK